MQKPDRSAIRSRLPAPCLPINPAAAVFVGKWETHSVFQGGLAAVFSIKLLLQLLTKQTVAAPLPRVRKHVLMLSVADDQHFFPCPLAHHELKAKISWIDGDERNGA